VGLTVKMNNNMCLNSVSNAVPRLPTHTGIMPLQSREHKRNKNGGSLSHVIGEICAVVSDFVTVIARIRLSVAASETFGCLVGFWSISARCNRSNDQTATIRRVKRTTSDLSGTAITFLYVLGALRAITFPSRLKLQSPKVI